MRIPIAGGREHFFSRNLLFHGVGPLVGGILMGLLIPAMQAASSLGASRTLLRAAILLAVTVALTAMVPWRRLPEPAKVIPPLLYLVAALFFYEAGGGSDTAYTQLLLLPVLWLASYGSWPELITGELVAASLLIVPLAIAGGRPEVWQRAVILVIVGIALGVALKRLLDRLRWQNIEMDRLARTDPMTGVANRLVWDEDLAEALTVAGAERAPVSIAVLDVDEFKRINDSSGHRTGDRLLKEFAAKWTGELRDVDLLARWGGDEFAVLLPRCSLEQARAIVERLGEELPGGHTCSAGLATWNGRESAEEFFDRADGALYRAKDAGRNRVEAA